MSETELLQVSLPLNREAVIYIDPQRQEAHDLSASLWTPEQMGFVTRTSLAAHLRALAEVIDPGTYEEHLERQRIRLGAESITRA